MKNEKDIGHLKPILGKIRFLLKKMSFQYGEKKPNTVAGFNWNGSGREKFGLSLLLIN